MYFTANALSTCRRSQRHSAQCPSNRRHALSTLPVYYMWHVYSCLWSTTQGAHSQCAKLKLNPLFFVPARRVYCFLSESRFSGETHPMNNERKNKRNKHDCASLCRRHDSFTHDVICSYVTCLSRARQDSFVCLDFHSWRVFESRVLIEN